MALTLKKIHLVKPGKITKSTSFYLIASVSNVALAQSSGVLVSNFDSDEDPWFEVVGKVKFKDTVLSHSGRIRQHKLTPRVLLRTTLNNNNRIKITYIVQYKTDSKRQQGLYVIGIKFIYYFRILIFNYTQYAASADMGLNI